jgi:amidase
MHRNSRTCVHFEEGSKKVEDIIFASATALAQAIREKQISSREVVGAYIQRIETINPMLNSVVQMRIESALAEAGQADEKLARGENSGPLHGVPFTIKDTYDVAGMICTCGTRGRAAHVAQHDAAAVARLRGAGGIALGLTNLPEFLLAYESDNLVYGRTNNPYDLTRTPGGSSGGEAATVAAGGSPLGLGTDSGGSIRVPAHFCGVAGLKPTWGRVPLTGLFPPPFGTNARLRHAGPLARHVEDLALALPIIAGMDWRDPGVTPMSLGDMRTIDLKSLRVAFFTSMLVGAPTPETVKTVQAAAQRLVEAGAAVEEATPPGIEQSFEFFRSITGADGGLGLRIGLQMVGTTDVSPLLEQSVALASIAPLSVVEFGGLMIRWDVWRSAMLAFLEVYDVLLSPVAATPALPHGSTVDLEKLPGFGYAIAHNLTGWPAVSVRGGTSPEGLPIGVQVVARPWREDVALAVAQHLETTLGGWQRPPL